MKNLLLAITTLLLLSSCGNDYQALDNGVNAMQASDKLDRTERKITQRAVLMVKSELGKYEDKHLLKHTIIDGMYNVGDTVFHDSFHTTTVLEIK